MNEKKYIEITMPQLGANDVSATIVEWLIEDGVWVEKGEAIVLVETAKQAAELEALESGYLYVAKELEQTVKVGEVIAIMTKVAHDQQVQDYLKSLKPLPKLADQIEPKLSAKAKALAAELGIDITTLPTDRILREDDILNVANERSQDMKTTSMYVNKRPSHDSKIIIFGGGGHGKMCIDMIRQQKIFDIYGVIDDGLTKNEEVLGVPVLGTREILPKLIEEGYRYIVNGVGGIARIKSGAPLQYSKRFDFYRMLKELGFILPNIIHPKATIEPSAKLGEGNQIMANAVVGSDVQMSTNCVVNSGAILSHDSYLGNNVHLAPGAILAGHVKVGDHSIIGMGSTVYIDVEIGKQVIINNGCHVFRDVADNRIIKENYY